jgi:glycosyltransferase involved in cell wall biosynthesis
MTIRSKASAKSLSTMGSSSPILGETEPLRVCFLIDRLNRAGTESQLVALIRNLNRSRISPFLCLLDGQDAISRSLEPENCPVIRLGIRSLHHPRTLKKAWQFVRFLKRERIHLLQVYFPDSTYFGALLARLADVPHVIQMRNDLGYWRSAVDYRLGSLYKRLVDHTVANCEVCAQAARFVEKIPKDSITVLENGVDIERFSGIADLAPTWSAPMRIGAVANLRPVKNLELLVRAAAQLTHQHPLVHFVIAGDGELRATLEVQIRQFGLEGRFVLQQSVADIPAFLDTLHVAVLSSQSEGMSNALLEYMAAGRAIVATAVGANGQVIEHGVHGLLVPPNDQGAMVQALDFMLRHPAEAARMGAAARERVEKHYSRQAMVQRFEQFYLSLGNGSGAASRS